MLSVLISKNEFKNQVLQSLNGKCACCNDKAVDAYHILDRSLWDDGGYYKNNGAPLCLAHHLQCENTIISPKELRKFCGTSSVIPPPFFIGK